MRWKAVVIALVAAPATLFGHSLTYALGSLSLADGRHTYFIPALQALVSVALAFGFAFVVRSLLVGGTAAQPSRSTCAELSRSTRGWPQFFGIWAVLSFTQCALFISVESFEGYRVGLFGCLMQCAVALIAAIVVMLFGALLEQCEEIALVCGTYLLRGTNRLAVLHEPSLSLVAISRLNERRGVRRFQRPPPGL